MSHKDDMNNKNNREDINKNGIKFLQGKKVFLRPMEEEDLEFYYKGLWDKDMRRLTGTQAVFSKIGIQRWFEANSTDNSRIDLLICLQETNESIGDISLLDINHHNRRATVRLAIFNEANCGNGYGTEALQLLLEYGFDVLNLHRIGLDVYSYNERAIKSYEKVGFKVEGRIRDELFYNGKYHDSIIMGILDSEFRMTKKRNTDD